MEITAKFDHFNINVLNLERSIAFYKEALGLMPCGEIEGPEGAFKTVSYTHLTLPTNSRV